MSALQRSVAIAARHVGGAQGDLVRVLVNASSSVEAGLALAALRDSLPEADLVLLCNLRELFVEISTTPVSVPFELDVLERVRDYEHVGCSWRTECIGAHGVAGLEFIGEGNRVDAIMLHLFTGRIPLLTCDEDLVNPKAIDALFANEDLAEELVESLRSLGLGVSPRFYLSVTDYVVENADSLLEEVGGFEGLF